VVEEVVQGGKALGTPPGNFKNFDVLWCPFIIIFGRDKNMQISSNYLLY